MALTKHGIRAKFGLIWKTKTVERERREEEKKRRGRGRRRREEENEGDQSKVWNNMVLYGITWAFKALNGFPCKCMVISCLQT